MANSWNSWKRIFLHTIWMHSNIKDKTYWSFKKSSKMVWHQGYKRDTTMSLPSSNNLAPLSTPAWINLHILSFAWKVLSRYDYHKIKQIYEKYSWIFEMVRELRLINPCIFLTVTFNCSMWTINVTISHQIRLSTLIKLILNI